MKVKVSFSYLIRERLMKSSVYRKIFNECLNKFFAMSEVDRLKKEFNWSRGTGIVLTYYNNDYRFEYILNGVVDEVYWMDHSTDEAINALGIN